MSKLTPDEEISCLITAIETLERRDFIGRTVDEKNGYCTATNDIKEIIKKYHPSLLTQKELPKLEKGDKIKLYGVDTTVESFGAQWNDSLDPPTYEIILFTTGRADPFLRSLCSIELIDNQNKENGS